MFQINNNTGGGNGGKFITAGINQDIEFIGFSRANTKEDGSGVEYTGLTFTNGENNFVAKLWDIDEERVKANATAYPDDKNGNPKTFTKDVKNPDGTIKWTKGSLLTPEGAVDIANQVYSSTLVAILDKFMPAEEIIINPKDYNDLVNQANTLLGKKAIGVKVRLKLVFDNKDYLTLPKFNFIELMSVNPSKLKIDPQYDKVVKSVAQANPTHPADTTSAAQSEDLPF